jgi:hypothetical protein
MLQIVGGVVELEHLHATLDAADHRVLLVFAEVVTEGAAQQTTNLRYHFGHILTRTIRPFPVLDAGQVGQIRHKSCRHVLDRHDEVDQTGRGGATRHADLGVLIELGLGQGQPAVLLDRPHALRAVASAAGKNNASRALTLILGKAREKCIDWAANTPALAPAAIAAGPLQR